MLDIMHCLYNKLKRKSKIFDCLSVTKKTNNDKLFLIS